MLFSLRVAEEWVMDTGEVMVSYGEHMECYGEQCEWFKTDKSQTDTPEANNTQYVNLKKR